MGYDVSFHPISPEEMREWYFTPLTWIQQGQEEKVLALAAQYGMEDFYAEKYLNTLRVGAETEADELFDKSHGFYIAVIQGFFRDYYYTRGSAFSFLVEQKPEYARYFTSWEQITPVSFQNPMQNRIIENYCSGVYLSPDQVVTVTNTGSRAGAEIVQVYAAKSDAQIFRPAQELKAFTKVWLEAGESKTVTLPLDDKAFRYWNTKTDSWEVEGGTYEFRVGASSADIRLTAAVEVNGTSAPNPYAGKALPHYTSGKVQHVPDDEWEILLGRPIPADTVKIDRNMTLGELNHSRSPLCWLVWAVLTMLLNASYKRGKPNLNVMFQYNMPLRALAKMTNGAISMGMVDGIVLEAKGFWVIGLLKVIVEAVKNIILNAQLESRLRNS